MARVNRRPAARAVLCFSATARIVLRTRPWHVPTDSVLVTVLLPQLALCENLDRAAGTLGSMCALDDCDPVRSKRRSHGRDVSGHQDMCDASDICRSAHAPLVSWAVPRTAYGRADGCCQTETQDERGLNPLNQLFVRNSGQVVAWRGHLARQLHLDKSRCADAGRRAAKKLGLSRSASYERLRRHNKA